MIPYSLNRRRFLRLGTAIFTLPFMPALAFGECPEEYPTAWYRAAKFGMFIHWGHYSLASV
jgi:alpha-L-fucosidase